MRATDDALSSLDLARALQPDVIILDVIMPGMDGLTLCRELRQRTTAPILMISGLAEDIDRIVGLEVGADDYLPKPFNPKEMVARVRALFRRLKLDGVGRADPPKQAPGLRLDPGSFKAFLKGTELGLTRLEFLLLQHLSQANGRVLTRQHLLDAVWGPDYVSDERLVDTHVRNLRRKFKQASSTYSPIHAVRGVGYRFEE